MSSFRWEVIELSRPEPVHSDFIKLLYCPWLQEEEKREANKITKIQMRSCGALKKKKAQLTLWVWRVRKSEEVGERSQAKPDFKLG